MSASASTSSSTDLVRFLLARLDDEDAEARRRARRQRTGSGERPDETTLLERLRTETLARRQVVGAVQQLLVLRDQPNEKAVRDIALQILRSMATPYSQHTSFREEWHAGTR